VIATVVIYGIPQLRAVPLYLARSLGRLAATRRSLAIAYVALLFFGLPLLLLAASGGLPSAEGDESAPVEAAATVPENAADAAAHPAEQR